MTGKGNDGLGGSVYVTLVDRSRREAHVRGVSISVVELAAHLELECASCTALVLKNCHSRAFAEAVTCRVPAAIWLGATLKTFHIPCTEFQRSHSEFQGSL